VFLIRLFHNGYSVRRISNTEGVADRLYRLIGTMILLIELDAYDGTDDSQMTIAYIGNVIDARSIEFQPRARLSSKFTTIGPTIV